MKFVIYGRPVKDWVGLHNVLRPACSRITALTVMMAPECVPFARHINNTACSAALSAFLDHLGHPPNLRDLTVDDRLTGSLGWPSIINLSPGPRLVGTFDLDVPKPSRDGSTGKFFDMQKYQSFCARQAPEVPLDHLDPLSTLV